MAVDLEKYKLKQNTKLTALPIKSKVDLNKYKIKPPEQKTGASAYSELVSKQFGEDVKKRAGETGEIFSDYLSGKQGAVSTGLQFLGKAAALGLADTPINLFTKAFSPDVVGKGEDMIPPQMHPQIKKAKENIKTGVEKGKDFITRALTTKQKHSGKSLLDTYNELKEAHPEAVRNVQAVGNIAFGYGSGKQLLEAASQIPVKTAIKGATAPVVDLAKPVASGAKFVYGQATGLEPKTISSIIEQPKAFSKAKMAETTRGNLAEKVGQALDTKAAELSETGKVYQGVRELRKPVVMPKGGVESHLSENYGLDVVDGKIIRSPQSIQMKDGDLKALQDFYDLYGKKQVLQPNEFLNARQNLAQMAEYDALKSDTSNILSRDLRDYYNQFGRPQIKGLAELDAEYAPRVAEFKQLKKDYLMKDPATGELRLKDGAASKIANLTGKGKEQVLGRLEEALPGVTKEINILKSIEDVEASFGNKVGTYVRAGLQGGGLVGGIVTGNVPLVAASIASNPKVALQILRGYGTIKQVGKDFISKLSSAMERGVALTEKQKSFVNESLKNIIKKKP